MPAKCARGLLLFLLLAHLMVAGEEEKPTVISSTTFIDDIAQNVGGEHFEYISLLPVGADPHTYEPVPGDVREVADADLVLENGLYLEVWLEQMIRNSGTDAPIVTATDGIDPIHSEEYQDAPDPHAWMSAKNGKKYAQNIRDALIDLRPEKEEAIRENYRQYRQELEDLGEYIQEKISEIPGENRILITTHDAFAYYGKEYDLEVDALMGLSTDADVQLEDMERLSRVIQERDVPAIFVESTVNPRLFNQMTEDLNISIGGELYGDSLGKPGEEAGTYIGMLKHNTRLIHSGLTGEAAGSRFSPLSYGFLSLMLLFFLGAFVYVSRNIRKTGRADQLPSNYAIKINGLNVSFEKKPVLTNIFLHINRGKIHGLIGPNGAGKTTLIKSIMGLLDPDSGHITLNDQPLHDYQKYIAYIPQKEEIDWTFPATVEDIVMMGRYIHKGVFESLNEEDYRQMNNALDKMDIKELRNRQIGELSGGQQQRVFLARAICQQAEIYLMDEPFVGVDLTTEQKIMEIIRSFARQGKTMLLIHHDLSRVEQYFDEVIMVNQCIMAAGPTKEVFSDENIRKTYSGKPTMLQKTESYLS